MLIRAAFISLTLVLLFSQTTYAQERETSDAKLEETKSCNEFAPPSKQSMGKAVGVEQCQIISEETVFNVKGHKFRRVEIRLTGTVEGWASLETGNRANYFTDGPDFVFTQSELTGPRARGIGRYRAETGHGITLIYPEEAHHWNGKLFMTAHGAGSYTPVGTLMPRDPNLKFNPLQGVNKYVGMMIDKGYAVGHTMRSSDLIAGDIEVTLEDGNKLQERKNLGSHAGLMIGWTKLTQNFVLRRVGSVPKRTYLYGHSAGGFLGKQINYQPGANAGPDGKPVFDGFLADDAGAGLWLPKLVVDGKDILFATDEERKKFVKQIDVSHALYLGRRDGSEDYLQKKRENAVMLREKGLGAQHRVYEIRGVSHFDAGSVSPPDLVHQNLDLTGLFDAFIDRLDAWVERDVQPPSSKSDLMKLGDMNKDGVNENPAIALPEVACPLGVHYIFPPGVNPDFPGAQETAFARFDGTNQEPLDARGHLVDMNGNGKRDKRETVTQAWQRQGLLKQGQKFTQSVYVKCVKAAAAKLVKDALLPRKVEEAYVEQAARMRLPEQGPTN
jgi:Alpha/beta hydrolase domain